MLVLDTHDTTAPLSAGLLVVVVGFSELLLEQVKIGHVFLVNISESNASGGLHVAEFTESSLAADESVGNLLLTAESGQVDDAFDGVNIVSHDDKLSLTLFDKSGHVVKTELEVDGLGSLGITTLLSFSLKAELLLSLSLRLVLTEDLEDLGSLVVVNSLAELVDAWWDLKTLEQDALLTLDADILGPSNEAGQVLGESDSTTNAEVAGVLGEEGAGLARSLAVSNDNLAFLCSFGLNDQTR